MFGDGMSASNPEKQLIISSARILKVPVRLKLVSGLQIIYNFPRGKYSDKIGALIIQKGEIITTIYGTGKVTMTMIKSEGEAKESLQNLKNIINEAIAKGVVPAPVKKSGSNLWKSTNTFLRPTVPSVVSRATIPLL